MFADFTNFLIRARLLIAAACFVCTSLGVVLLLVHHTDLFQAHLYPRGSHIIIGGFLGLAVLCAAAELVIFWTLPRSDSWSLAAAWMKRFAAPDMTDEFPGWQRQSAGAAAPVEAADRPGEIERAGSVNAMRLALQQNEANRPAYVGIWIVLSLALWALIALIISHLL